jgi:hypothetical protein
VTGRRDYTDPGEKFENVVMMLFEPASGKRRRPKIQLFDAKTGASMTEKEYFLRLRQIYNDRNPHAHESNHCFGPGSNSIHNGLSAKSNEGAH